jgi:hypothetical protein
MVVPRASPHDAQAARATVDAAVQCAANPNRCVRNVHEMAIGIATRGVEQWSSSNDGWRSRQRQMTNDGCTGIPLKGRRAVTVVHV